MVRRGASGTGHGSWSSLHDLFSMDVHKETIVVAVTATSEVAQGYALWHAPEHASITREASEAAARVRLRTIAVLLRSRTLRLRSTSHSHQAGGGYRDNRNW